MQQWDWKLYRRDQNSVALYLFNTHWISVLSRWRIACHFPDVLLKTDIKCVDCLSTEWFHVELQRQKNITDMSMMNNITIGYVRSFENLIALTSRVGVDL